MAIVVKLIELYMILGLGMKQYLTNPRLSLKLLCSPEKL